MGNKIKKQELILLDIKIYEEELELYGDTATGTEKKK